MTYKPTHPPAYYEPDPSTMTDACLRCAWRACSESAHADDQRLAMDCAREMERRGFAKPMAKYASSNPVEAA